PWAAAATLGVEEEKEEGHLLNIFCIFLLNLYFFNLFRIFLEHVNSKKARASNINCVVTTDVRHDGSEPVVDIMFGKEFIIHLKGNRWGAPGFRAFGGGDGDRPGRANIGKDISEVSSP
uniref:Large ribosomal subunit protein mL53 n=1 Tax=Chelonoidis abingdonii TaxID=106734 RepID=A0A8C0GZS5_CHEAB